MKLYIGKIKELTEKQRGSILTIRIYITAKEATLKLNVDAANRFITHALAENTINNNNSTSSNTTNTTAPSKNSNEKEKESRKRK